MWTSLTGTHYYHSNWSYLSVFVNHSMASRSYTILSLNQNPILHNMVCRTLTIKLRVLMERKCVLFHSQNGDVDKLYLNEKPDKSEFDEVCVFGILYCINFEQFEVRSRQLARDLYWELLISERTCICEIDDPGKGGCESLRSLCRIIRHCVEIDSEYEITVGQYRSDAFYRMSNKRGAGSWATNACWKKRSHYPSCSILVSCDHHLQHRRRHTLWRRFKFIPTRRSNFFRQCRCIYLLLYSAPVQV